MSFIVPEAKRLVQPGQKFSRLTVAGVPFYLYENRRRRERCVVECECGSFKIIASYNLVSGNSTTCGCGWREAITRHGNCSHPIYNVWRAMRSRITVKTNKLYRNYGGRGLTICDEWLDFSIFYKWAMSHGYEKGLSIDRIDNNSGYRPDNCRWVVVDVQVNNTRRNVFIEAFGERKTRQQWTEDPRCVVKYDALKHRINIGIPPEIAITTPTQRRGQTIYVPS